MRKVSISLSILFALILAACAPGTPAPQLATTVPAEVTPQVTILPPTATLPAVETSPTPTQSSPTDTPQAPTQPPSTETETPASQFPVGVVYTIGAGNGLWLVGADGQTQLLSEQQYPTLSPDQQQILYSISYDGEIWLSDLATGESRNLTNTPDRIEESFQWWPANSGVIVFSSRPADNLGGYLATINVDGTDYRVLDEEIGSISPAAPSPDGQTITFDRGGEPWLYHLDGGLEPIDFSAFGLAAGKAGFPEWSPNGKMLAWKVYGQDGTSGVAVLDLVQGKGVLLHPYTILGGSEMFAELAWSPDGQWLAVANQAEIAGERVSLWVVRVDGSQEHYLGGRASSPAWSLDSRYLVYSQVFSDASASDVYQTMLVEVGDWQPSVQDLPGGAQVEDWVNFTTLRAEGAFSTGQSLFWGKEHPMQAYGAGFERVYNLRWAGFARQVAPLILVNLGCLTTHQFSRIMVLYRITDDEFTQAKAEGRL